MLFLRARYYNPVDEASKEYYLRAREICKRQGWEFGVSKIDVYLGMLATVQRDLIEAKAHFENYLKANWVRVHSREGSGSYLGYVNLLLGNTKVAQQELDKSLKAVAEYLSQSSVIPDPWLILEGKARLELGDRHALRASLLFGASWTQREQDDYPITEAERPDYEAAIAEAHSAIGDAAFDDAFAKGQAMTLEEAIAFALKESDE